MIESVWVFCGENSRFPGGVFSSTEAAEIWIKRNRLTGVLTEYKLDLSAYDWAIAQSAFTPTKPAHASPQFIGSFTSAAQPHIHYANGERD